MFADGTQIIAEEFRVGRSRWTNETFLCKFYSAGLLAILPIVVYLFFGQPVGLLQTAGAIEAAHIPVVAGLTLFLNYRMLPRKLRPSGFTFWGTVIAGLFFAVFAVIYLLQLVGVLAVAS
jgi:hypothetical protein